MKLNIKYFIKLSVVMAIIVLNACGEKAQLENIAPAEGAGVRFMHAIPGGASALVIYANDKKFTAVNNTVALGPDSIAYGGVFPATDYALLPAGSVKFVGKIPIKDSTLLAETSFNLESGKYYFLVAADTLPKPKFLLIKDERGVVKNGNKTYLRFANFMPTTPAAGYDFYLRRNLTNTLIGTTKYGESGTYVETDPTPAIDTILVRAAGGTTNLGTFALGTTKLSANRTYTLFLRGTAFGATGTKAPLMNLITTN